MAAGPTTPGPVLLPTEGSTGPEARPTAAVARHQEGQEAARPEVRPTAVPSRPEGPEGVHLAAERRRARPTRAVVAVAAPQSPEAVRPEAAHRSLADQAAAGRPTAAVAAAAPRQRFRRRAARPRHL